MRRTQISVILFLRKIEISQFIVLVFESVLNYVKRIFFQKKQPLSRMVPITIIALV